MLHDACRFPHTIVNENGARQSHGGYVEKSCSVCGKMFIVGIGGSTLVLTCGRESCSSKENYGRQTV